MKLQFGDQAAHPYGDCDHLHTVHGGIGKAGPFGQQTRPPANETARSKEVYRLYILTVYDHRSDSTRVIELCWRANGTAVLLGAAALQ